MPVRLLFVHTSILGLLADSSKVNRVSTFYSAPIAAANTLITDSGCPVCDIELFRRAGLQVLQA